MTWEISYYDFRILVFVISIVTFWIIYLIIVCDNKPSTRESSFASNCIRPTRSKESLEIDLADQTVKTV